MSPKKKPVRGNNPLFVASKKRYVKTVHNDQQDDQNDFLGLTRLVDRSYSPLYKIVWFVIVATCFGGCTYQIAARVDAYLEGSITLEVKLRQQTFFTFPTITLCNPNLLAMVEEVFRTNDSQINGDVSFATTEELWTKYSGISPENLTAETMCFEENCAFPIADSMNIDYVNTVSGRCITLVSKNQTEYRGPYTYIQLNWNTSKSIESLRAKTYTFLIHNDTFKHRHDGMLKSENALFGYESSFRMYAKELVNLNSDRNPCRSAEEVNACLTNCVDKEILKLLTCRLPITGRSAVKKECSEFSEIYLNYLNLYGIFFNLSHYFEACQCKRPCNEIKYTLHKDDETVAEDNMTSLMLLYADDTHETVTEKEIFTPSALFSEIGGTIGLYLGISIIALVDFFESIVRRSCFKPKPQRNQQFLSNKVRKIY